MSEFSKLVAMATDKAKRRRGGVGDMAHYVGTNSSTLSKWRKGNYLPSKEVQERFIEKSTEYFRKVASEESIERQRIIDASLTIKSI